MSCIFWLLKFFWGQSQGGVVSATVDRVFLFSTGRKGFKFGQLIVGPKRPAY